MTEESKLPETAEKREHVFKLGLTLLTFVIALQAAMKIG